MLQHMLYKQTRVLHLPPEMWDCVAKHRLYDRGCFGGVRGPDAAGVGALTVTLFCGSV